MTQPDQATKQDPVARFLEVYDELVQRGAWIPKLHDEKLPAMVWIDLIAFWTTANANGLHMCLPSVLKEKLRRPPKHRIWPRLSSMSRPLGNGREHLVLFDDPFTESGPYRCAAEDSTRPK